MGTVASSQDYLHGYPLLFLVYLFFLPTNSISQDHGRSLLEQAESQFIQGDYDIAIQSYETFLETSPEDIPARVNLGKALMKLKKYSYALQQWKHLISGKSNVSSEWYYYAGRASHHLNQFKDAEKFYRLCIESAGDNADLKLLSYYLRQVGSAHTAGIAHTRCLVENAGSLVNTIWDDIHPVYSPNFTHRFYYTTIKDPLVTTAGTSVGNTFSMKYAEVTEGVWQESGPLDQDLVNSQAVKNHNHELHLLDFTKDGQKVLFTVPDSGNKQTLFIKSFEDLPGQENIFEWIHPVYKSFSGDRDLFIIHDSAYLFSSKRFEGYGGYDIFVTFKQRGNWIIKNLGPQINSKYDEVAPFLSRDGREIYFSSNSDRSIGGYDIFFATFDDDMETWNIPRNMAQPLNSGMDDIGIQLSREGNEALFASNRSGGYGGYDIYQIYFDDIIRSQRQYSQPAYFYQVSTCRTFGANNKAGSRFREKDVYELPTLWFGTKPVILSSGLKSKLDDVAKFSLLYPQTTLLLNVFSNTPPVTDYSLLRPVFMLQNLTEYFVERGIDPERIQYRLYGCQYPDNTITFLDTHYESGMSMSSDRRVEFGFDRTENLSIEFTTTNQKDKVEQIQNSKYNTWKQKTKGLYFRVQMAVSENWLKGVNLVEAKDYVLIINKKMNRYTYFSGLFKDVENALEVLKNYKSNGYNRARLVAFIGETIISDEQITTTMIENYPELKKYIIYQN